MTAQLLNDSSSVGHRAACIIWKEIKEKYELQCGINIYRHVDDVDEGYFIVLTKKLGKLKMLMHMLVPLYKQYKSQYCRLLGACFVQLCNSSCCLSYTIWWITVIVHMVETPLQAAHSGIFIDFFKASSAIFAINLL